MDALRPSPLQRGIWAINVSMPAFVVSDIVLKLLGASLPMTEIIFLRSCVIAIALAVLFAVRRQKLELSKKMSAPMLVRCLLDCVCIAAITTAIINMGLAEMYAILLTAPLLMTVIAAVFLKEPVGYRRWLAVFVGFFGVVLIIKPNPLAIDVWALIAFLSAIATACREVVTRKIDQNIPTLEITLHSALFAGTAAVLVGFVERWSAPNQEQTFLLIVQALAWFAGTSFVIYACRVVPMSTIAPFRYTTLIWGGAASYLVFGSVPDKLTLAGTFLIGGAGLYTFHREAVRQRAMSSNTSQWN